MPVITSARPPVKSSRTPRAFSCSIVSMTIAINDVRYSVDQTDPGECGSKSFRLTKHSAKDGGTYDVIRQHDGIVACDCPDYEARHRGNGYGMCKHGTALVTLGLLAAPIATVAIATPAPEPCCSPSEAAPCVACFESPVVRHPEKTSADVFPTDTVDPNDAESAPDLSGPETDTNVWTVAEPDPTPVGDDDHLANTAESDPASPWHAPFSVTEPYEPSDADRADAAEMFGQMEAVAHLDRSDCLTPAELVEHQVAFYEGWGNPAGQMFADAMTKLLAQVRLTSASCPAELDARIDAMEADARDAWQTAGYEEGRRSAAGIDVFV